MLKVSNRMTITELWETGMYQKLTCRAASLQSLRATLSKFKQSFPEMVEKHITTEQRKSGNAEVVIENIAEFIDLFNTAAKKRAEDNLLTWRGIEVDCYERNCNCTGCYYAGLESIETCTIKNKVPTLLKMYGEPKIEEFVYG